MINFRQWLELFQLAIKNQVGIKGASRIFDDLFPNLHYYMAGDRKHYFDSKKDFCVYTLALLYNSGLADIPKEYIHTVSFLTEDGKDYGFVEIKVPGLPRVNVALDTYFITDDTGENGEIVVNGHIGG